MSDQSGNRGSHHSKVADNGEPRVDSDKGSQNGPHEHSGVAQNDQDNSQRHKVAASTPYMPQAGKPAGTHDVETDKTGQIIGSDTDNHPRDRVAASTPYMPQSGKPAGNSSL